MAEPEPTASVPVFAGDLDDPWVRAIAAALPASTARWHCPGGLPDELAGPTPALVVHRADLSEADLRWFEGLRRGENGPGRVVVCLGPHARYVRAERLAGAVDAILPEATAAETVGRHVPGPRLVAGRCRVGVVSGLFDLRRALGELVASLGHDPEPAAGWDDLEPGGLAIWDVPRLDGRWPAELARRSAGRKVVALLGFADREAVGTARASGASACLELPCDRDDLGFVLARLAASPEAGHAVPPPPAALRRGASAMASTGPGV